MSIQNKFCKMTRTRSRVSMSLIRIRPMKSMLRIKCPSVVRPRFHVVQVKLVRAVFVVYVHVEAAGTSQLFLHFFFFFICSSATPERISEALSRMLKSNRNCWHFVLLNHLNLVTPAMHKRRSTLQIRHDKAQKLNRGLESGDVKT